MEPKQFPENIASLGRPLLYAALTLLVTLVVGQALFLSGTYSTRGAVLAPAAVSIVVAAIIILIAVLPSHV